MFNLGFLEIFVLLVLGLVFLGPDQFPQLVRKFLRIFYDLKKAFREIKLESEQVESELNPSLQKPDKENE